MNRMKAIKLVAAGLLIPPCEKSPYAPLLAVLEAADKPLSVEELSAILGMEYDAMLSLVEQAVAEDLIDEAEADYDEWTEGLRVPMLLHRDPTIANTDNYGDSIGDIFDLESRDICLAALRAVGEEVSDE